MAKRALNLAAAMLDNELVLISPVEHTGDLTALPAPAQAALFSRSSPKGFP